MTRTERLQPVLRHNDEKEQRALLVVARSQAALQQEIDRLDQLKQYQQEYLQKGKQESAVFTALEMQEYSRFIAQLDETIERQMEIVRVRQQELEQTRNLWIRSRVDSKKIHKVVEKLQQQEVIAEERLEQKTLDEFSSRKRPLK